MNRNDLNARLPQIVESLSASILSEPRMQHLDRVFLPNRDLIISAIKQLRQLLYPGYFGNQNLTKDNLPYRLGELVLELTETLHDQVRGCLRYREQLPDSSANPKTKECDQHACEIVAQFFARIPAIREILATDVQAAFDSDPAARSTDETIFCYPGLLAISIQRLAHEFHKLDVPLLPRIMTEYAHSLTGIDIHPGAQLGRSFFIDHGTGIVIGETTTIGNNVKLYQGVTLGALAPHFGQMLRGEKRHPTIEDDVIIYAASTILGGDTVIGKGSVIGGNVFLTTSVPPHTQVSMEPPRLKYRERRKSRTPEPLDFQI
ncbi:MAG TPA: serine O-acetyltransferase EpsC [Tepidisphaeraceae bacterium]|jgi:serine O-acetyltransferase|nr:serine O-acetyltransferase EpsC [Tepidisphaeraceae bacterium]